MSKKGRVRKLGDEAYQKGKWVGVGYAVLGLALGSLLAYVLGGP